MGAKSQEVFAHVAGQQSHRERVEYQKGIEERTYAYRSEDFLQSSSGTLPDAWAVQDTSAAGSPTLDYVDDAALGQFELTHDSQDEAQNLTLYWGDSLHLDPTKGLQVDIRCLINTSTAQLTANQRLVVGLASARNATLDSITDHVWMRLEGDGANFDILMEGDDGTTDTNDQDSGLNWSDNSFATFRFNFETLTEVVMEVDLEDGSGFQYAGEVSVPLMTSQLQPYIELQKDSGAETHSVIVDYVSYAVQR